MMLRHCWHKIIKKNVITRHYGHKSWKERAGLLKSRLKSTFNPTDEGLVLLRRHNSIYRDVTMRDTRRSLMETNDTESGWVGMGPEGPKRW